MRDTPALILPIYMTTVLGLEAALAGLVIMIAKFWVVIADPIAGVISDQTETRWGRRRPFILVGGLIAALTFVLLFFCARLAGSNSTVRLRNRDIFTTKYGIFDVLGAVFNDGNGNV